MKNRKCLTFTIVLTLFALIITSTITAGITQKNVNQIEEEQTCFGTIYGNTGTSLGWGFTPVFFAKVNVGCRTTYSSHILGYYKICGLPLGTYTITGSKRGYDTFTDTVTLTENDPREQIFINLEPNGDSLEKTNLGRLADKCLGSCTFLYNVRKNHLQS